MWGIEIDGIKTEGKLAQLLRVIKTINGEWSIRVVDGGIDEERKVAHLKSYEEGRQAGVEQGVDGF